MENLLYGMMMREERREMPRKMYDMRISPLMWLVTLPVEALAMTVANPRPRQAVRRGEPNVDETPILGRPARATAVSATKSPMELAQAST